MRRVVVGTAGLLSLTAAASLPAIWYDDGTSARSALALLTGIDGRYDRVDGLWTARLAVLVTVMAVLAGVLAVVRGLLPPTPPVVKPPAGGLLSPLVLPADPPGRRAAGWAAGGHGSAAILVALAGWRLGSPVATATPRAAMVLAGGTLAWWLATARSERTLRSAAAALIAFATVLTAQVGGPWLVDGRLDRLVTSSASEGAPAGPAPAGPGAVRWSRPAADSLALGPYVVVREPAGGRPASRITVLEGASGIARWSYRHDRAFIELAGDPQAEILLLLLDLGVRQELRAFDLSSGYPLWSRRDAGRPVAWGSGALLLLDRDGTRLRGLDARSGDRRWERELFSSCELAPEFVRSAGLAVAVSRCGRTPVTAIRLDTGATVWVHRLLPGGSTGRPPLLLGGGTVAVRTVDGSATALVGFDAGTGTVRWRRPADPDLFRPAVVAGRLVQFSVDRRNRPVATAVDPVTGRTAWTTELPWQARGTEAMTAASDGSRWYLFATRNSGGTGTTRLVVLDAKGDVVGVGRFDGCSKTCRAGQLSTGTLEVAAAGGTLVVLRSRFGPDQDVVGIGPGPAFTPAP